ncbi:MAG: hypothetical protein ABI855_01960 [Bacteroidota bacterium]
MKKNLFISAILAGVFFISSCRKMEHEDTAISKVINVELKQNESYSYTIPPTGDADDVMEISQQAQHAAISKITGDAARNTLFEYTPAENYTGSDEVHVNTVGGDHKGGNGGHHQGNCQGHGNDTETNYIFKINISSSSTSDPH